MLCAFHFIFWKMALFVWPRKFSLYRANDKIVKIPFISAIPTGSVNANCATLIEKWFDFIHDLLSPWVEVLLRKNQLKFFNQSSTVCVDWPCTKICGIILVWQIKNYQKKKPSNANWIQTCSTLWALFITNAKNIININNLYHTYT